MAADGDLPEVNPEPEEKKARVRGRSMYAVVSILAIEMCERLTFYSITANIMLYCTGVLNMDDPQAVKVSQIFAGTALIMPLFGGVVGDSITGRYNAVLGSALIYIIGLVMVPISAVDYRPLFGYDSDGSSYDMSDESRRVFFLTGLACIAVGTGGIKASVAPFGAQQLERFGKGAVRSYFNWFYWFINIGSTVAFTGVAYVQQNVSFTWGFLIPLISMLLALILFITSRSAYVILPPGESSLKQACGVLIEAFKKIGDGRQFLESPRKRAGGSYDDDTVAGVISVLKTLVLFLPIVGWSLTYFQSNSLMYLQALRMNVVIGDFYIPVAALGIFNTIIILVVIPLFDSFLYPYLEKIGKPFTHIRRMGVGMVVATVGLVISGVVEYYRKKELATSGGMVQNLGGKDYTASHMSVFLQVPQLLCSGISEVFIVALEFSFTQVPFSMQGLMQGTVLALFGVGGYLGTALLDAVNAATSDDPWLSAEMNDSHADNFFFLLAALLVVTGVTYFAMLRCTSAHN